MKQEEELINMLILTRLSYYHLNPMVELYRHLGSATAIMEQRHDLKTLCPAFPDKIIRAFDNVDILRTRAEEELRFATQHDIRILCLNDEDYPSRLRQCPDAPLVLFYKGRAELNAAHVINVVGTRQATIYGQDLIRRLVGDLRTLCPDTIIVSGLAYGVDICAHREALAHGLETVGVLAHGLDTIYPQRHRDTAREMLCQGGLLTEFMSKTNADKLNFIRRNRIVAGIADACVLIESATKGGGLITARIARDYNRDVFAFPGAVDAPYSAGCNALIRDNGAALITGAEDLVNAMGWQNAAKLREARQSGIPRQLFPTLSDNETRIVELLRQNNDLQLNIISMRTGLDIAQVSSLLFSLEMKGVLKPYAGGTYHLLQ